MKTKNYPQPRPSAGAIHMRTRLIRVEAPHFCAALETYCGKVVFAAPKLKWTINKKDTEVFAYFNRKGWTYQKLSRRKSKRWQKESD